jgi:hypothetical protein
MFRFAIISLLILLTLLLACTCERYQGYGRYSLKIGCDEVVIDSAGYKVVEHNDALMIGDRIITRGINRDARPWIYLHHRHGNRVDITFDEGLQPLYPLYTGRKLTIYNIYDQPWDSHMTTVFAFPDQHWLLPHRYEKDGVYIDVWWNDIPDTLAWEFVNSDIFVSPQEEVYIKELGTAVRLTEYDYDKRWGKLEFVRQ